MVATAPPELITLRPGETFAGKYVIERLLKAGGMGAVYVAKNRDTAKRVALKLMLPMIVAQPAMRARFAQEAQIAGMIESRGVVDVFDAGVDPATGAPFLVMELLSGHDLGDLLDQRGRFSLAEAQSFIGQAARVLDKAHARGIVHRDLKPENLFLVEEEGEQPRIKLLDFGIAKILQGAGPRITMAGGTPFYMAPEQTRVGEITSAADIWALGLIAYTLLVGRTYWRATSVGEVYGEILSLPFEPPSSRAIAFGVVLPTGFDEWFFGCVNRDPAARFGRAGDAADRFAALSPIHSVQSVQSVHSIHQTMPMAPDARTVLGGAMPTRVHVPEPPTLRTRRDDSIAGIPRWLLGVTFLALIVVPLMIVVDPLGKRGGKTEPTVQADPAAEPLPPPPSEELPTPSPTAQVTVVDVKEGTGRVARKGDRLSVHYVGELLDGTKFDSSRDRGQPFKFELGAGQVIAGWEQGLPGMRVGGTRHLSIPHQLAYGEAGRPPRIPPATTLNFEVELLAIE